MADSAERVVTDWHWTRYVDRGPWDRLLQPDTPTHGWRRELELDHGDWVYQVTEWHFGRRRPTDPTRVADSTVHAVRSSPPDPRAA